MTKQDSKIVKSYMPYNLRRIRWQELKEVLQVEQKHKKVLKAVKGQWGRRKNTIRVAKQAMEKAMQYAYRDRRNKKRDFKSLWIQRINAGVRAEGLTYSKFNQWINKCGIAIDEKFLLKLLTIAQKHSKQLYKKLNQL